MTPFYRYIHGQFWLIFKCLYRHKVYGLQNLPEGGAILAANHTSYYDPPLVGISCPYPIHYLARSSLFKHSFFRWMIEHLNAIPVKGNGQDIQSLKAVLRLLQKRQKVVIFPEGNRTADGKLKTLKTGVALISLRSGCPIIPTYIFGTFEVWPRTKRLPRLWGKTKCIFGTPIDPKNYLHLEKQEALRSLTEHLSDQLHALQHSSDIKSEVNSRS